MNKSATIKEFAAEISVSEKRAYGMARSDEFLLHKISHDISGKKKESKKRQKRTWRIDLEKYYEARDKGVI